VPARSPQAAAPAALQEHQPQPAMQGLPSPQPFRKWNACFRCIIAHVHNTHAPQLGATASRPCCWAHLGHSGKVHLLTVVMPVVMPPPHTATAGSNCHPTNDACMLHSDCAAQLLPPQLRNLHCCPSWQSTARTRSLAKSALRLVFASFHFLCSSS
jgi:hypothetical protein